MKDAHPLTTQFEQRLEHMAQSIKTPPSSENMNKYLTRCLWLYNRYKKPDGGIILSVGNKLTTYKKLEEAFFKKYILNGGKRR